MTPIKTPIGNSSSSIEEGEPSSVAFFISFEFKVEFEFEAVEFKCGELDAFAFEESNTIDFELLFDFDSIIFVFAFEIVVGIVVAVAVVVVSSVPIVDCPEENVVDLL